MTTKVKPGSIVLFPQRGEKHACGTAEKFLEKAYSGRLQNRSLYPSLFTKKISR
ncbi:MAG: hypothetical protein L6V93_04855 [Clostridiales bacterium]|nr:MAG: hypothetical protein L6V93_04855 [Clostridiales bacterium]